MDTELIGHIAISMMLIHIIYQTSVIDPVWGWGEKSIWKYLVFFCLIGQYLDLQIGKPQYIHIFLIIIHR